MRKYNLEVETIQAGQAGRGADSFYHYFIADTSEPALNKTDMRKFCKNFLRIGYPADDMPNPFAGEIVKFEQNGNTWEYKVREEFTG